ncbi:MAG: hypothetical protein KGI78_03720 [Patescibacteria group bacterium]|nr:hypothetical protein [Patescibacteria group bacterium]MDE1943996.1 hypothetical protein [Patescibacteria group bacterium]MDE1945066.1 hypothetical protein [Patescibacteria group bacterium]MDE2057934.1 hypothetical protein [Patescibacteria group bacterium]
MAEGSVPVTEPGGALQILTLKYAKGRLAAPHYHIPHQRETGGLQECFIVIRGRIRVFFFDDQGESVTHADFAAGETCLVLDGPHAIRFLEDSEVLEVKNGPFFDDKRFLSITDPLE